MPGTVAVSPRRSLLALAAKGTVALVGSVLCFWWAFHDVDLSHVGAELGRSSMLMVGAVFAGQLVGHVMRVVRWHLLVAPLGAPTRREVFTAASIGFPATFFLPLRLGEFVRPLLIARSGVPFVGAMASVVVERIADGITGVGLFFALLTILPGNAEVPQELATFATGALVVFGGGFVFMIVTVMAKNPAFALIRRLVGPISQSLATRIITLLDAFIVGASVLKAPLRLLAFVVITALYWALTAALVWIVADAYLPGTPFLLGPVTASITTFTIMIPAGPAFAGTLEVGMRLGMAPFGVTPAQAAVVALAFHAIQVVGMAVIGGVGLLSAGGRQRVDRDLLTLDAQPAVEEQP
ncbi:MAG: flippase-like domain-containing protein [Deltaproteobacteria bacterium]|nr:flippase-like domain-containing protein [Deltaproteobacteria bacterium]